MKLPWAPRWPAGWWEGGALALAVCFLLAPLHGPVSAARAQEDPWADEPVLFEDHFQDSLNTVFGHTPSITNNATLTFIGGVAELRRTTDRSGGAATLRLPGEYGHTTLGVDAWLVEPEVTDWLGLDCRTRADFSGYRLTVSPQDRRLRVDRFDGAEGTTLVDWIPIHPLFRDGRPHRIELHCVGSTIAVSLDGELVVATTDERYSAGMSGISAGGNGFIRVRFDNLVLQARDPSGPLGRLPRLPAPGTVLLADDFSDPPSGTVPVESTNPARVYRQVDGEYEIEKLDDEPRRGGVWPLGTYSDASLAVDVRVEPRETAQLVSLTCRTARDVAGSYDWYVNLGTGLITLLRADPDGYTVLAGPRFSRAVRPFPAWNRLELSCSGSTIALTVNEREVTSVEDSTYPQGQFYLGVLGEDGRAAARFDNLVITAR